MVAGAIAAWAWSREPAAKPPLGLYTSLPIYWAEAGSVSEALDGGVHAHVGDGERPALVLLWLKFAIPGTLAKVLDLG